MWGLPTYNRPQQCKAVIDQINKVGCTTPGVLFINGHEGLDEYKKIILPETWQLMVWPENIGVCAAMNTIYHAFPNEPFYGLICDDEYVYTPGWDTRLAAAAGPWNIAHGNEGWLSQKRIHSYVTVGGELARECGWWALPGLWHYFHDNVQEILAHYCGLRVFCEDVTTEHKHYMAGKAVKDATYALGESRRLADKECFDNWCNTQAMDLIKRIFAKKQELLKQLLEKQQAMLDSSAKKNS